MKIKTRFFLSSMAMLISSIGHSQDKDFAYRRKISTVNLAGWYSIQLPEGVFKNLNRQYSDLRIFRINEKDTAESPYFLKIDQRQESDETVDVSVVNQSKKGKTQYFTFEMPKGFQVNYLNLEFDETNFDGFVKLEGSNDQREWFEIEKHQRIISIENKNINFTSTSLHFSPQIFRFLRIQIDADKSLTLKNTSFKKRTIKKGKLHTADLNWKLAEDKKSKQSTYSISLKNYQPIVKLDVEINEVNDFYRSFRLEKLSDSSKTPKGWEYYYELIKQGVLTSLDSNSFNFDYVTAKKLRLIVDNGDNPSLKIKNISLQAPTVELITRLESGNHFLYYGNSKIGEPSYDLIHFKDKMPTAFVPLSLEGEERLLQPAEIVSPLIKNKIWLWAFMGLIILVLGFFTIKMMKGK